MKPERTMVNKMANDTKLKPGIPVWVIERDIIDKLSKRINKLMGLRV